VLVLGACAAAPPKPSGDPWVSAFGQQHPLTGRIWAVGDRRFIDPPALVARLGQARFVLLGESHDNLDHHRLEAWVIQALIAAGRRPAIGFEMLTADQAPAIAEYLATRPAGASGLGAAVGWGRTGWPPWPWYQPIAEAALAAGLPIVATNLAPATVQAILREGLAALGPAQRAQLDLDGLPDPAIQAAMAAEIQEAHCGMVPADRLDGLIAVQRARDAEMAARLAAAGGPDGAVLIAGAGHVRTDRGVPTFLARQAPGARALSLAFLQVRRDATDPEAYAADFGNGSPPFDYVWFTPRRDDRDPCEKYRVPLERLRRGAGG
jgi:uncharacterized iron-regulated protein